jgi:hypothetical protein
MQQNTHSVAVKRATKSQFRKPDFRAFPLRSIVAAVPDALNVLERPAKLDAAADINRPFK